MSGRKKFQNIDEYCKRCGFNSVMFYEVLRKNPSLATNLKTNSKGERVLDEESTAAVGKILQRKARKAKIEAAAAEELNFLVSENEKLKQEIKLLKYEIESLRGILTVRKAERKESIEK